MSSIATSAANLNNLVVVRYNSDQTRRRQLGQLVFYHTLTKQLRAAPVEAAEDAFPFHVHGNLERDWRDTWSLSSAFYNAVEDSLTKYNGLGEMLVDFPYLSASSAKETLEAYWARGDKPAHPVPSEQAAIGTRMWAIWAAARDGLQTLTGAGKLEAPVSGADKLGAPVYGATWRRVQEAKQRAAEASRCVDVALMGNLPKDFEANPTRFTDWKESFNTGMFVSFLMRTKEQHQGDGPLSWSSSDLDNCGRLDVLMLHQFCLDTIINSFDWFMHLDAADRDPNNKATYTDDGRESLTNAVNGIQMLVEGLTNPLAKEECKDALDLVQNTVEARKIRIGRDDEEKED